MSSDEIKVGDKIIITVNWDALKIVFLPPLLAGVIGIVSGVSTNLSDVSDQLSCKVRLLDFEIINAEVWLRPSMLTVEL
jgi:hypothetical protein